MSNNPKAMALLSIAVVAWLTYSLVTATERPSLALLVLHLVLIAGAIFGLIGALKRISSEDKPPRE